MTSLLTHFNDLLSPNEPDRGQKECSDDWTRYVAISFQSSLIYPTLRILNNLVDPNDASPLASITETWNMPDLRCDSVLGQFSADSVISRLAEFVFLQSVDARVLHRFFPEKINQQVSDNPYFRSYPQNEQMMKYQLNWQSCLALKSLISSLRFWLIDLGSVQKYFIQPTFQNGI